jgi:DNA-binding transcriptional regulator YiaG
MKNEDTSQSAALLARLLLPEPQTRQRIRQAAGVSRQAMGGTLGVSPEAVRLWERGDTQPGDGVVVNYLHLLRSLDSEAKTR